MKKTNVRIHVLGILFFVVLPVFGGCIGNPSPRQPIEFYQLEYAPPECSFDADPLPFVIRMDPFQPPDLYASQRIVYQENKYTSAQYTYHQWITPPAQMLTRFLTRDLRHAGIVRAVFLNGGEAATHRLVGNITAFYENDQQAQWEAVASISMTLINIGEKNIAEQICFQKTYEAREFSRENTPTAFVEAMSKAVKEISCRLTTDIYNELLEDKKQAPERVG